MEITISGHPCNTSPAIVFEPITDVTGLERKAIDIPLTATKSDALCPLPIEFIPELCTDVTASDDRSYDCKTGYNPTPAVCGEYDTDAFEAMVHCCACGGGTSRSTLPTGIYYNDNLPAVSIIEVSSVGTYDVFVTARFAGYDSSPIMQAFTLTIEEDPCSDATTILTDDIGDV